MFTIDLRVILLITVATGIYALLLKFLLKNSPHNVQRKGGGVKRLLNNVKKKLHFSYPEASLIVNNDMEYSGGTSLSSETVRANLGCRSSLLPVRSTSGQLPIKDF